MVRPDASQCLAYQERVGKVKSEADFAVARQPGYKYL